VKICGWCAGWAGEHPIVLELDTDLADGTTEKETFFACSSDCKQCMVDALRSMPQGAEIVINDKTVS